MPLVEGVEEVQLSAKIVIVVVGGRLEDGTVSALGDRAAPLKGAVYPRRIGVFVVDILIIAIGVAV